jgi:hypothetical protein
MEEDEMNERQKIGNFLTKNGWKYDGHDGEYTHYNCHNRASVDVGKDEIVFVGDIGDFAHIPLSYYALVGFVYVNRIIAPVI